MHHARICNFSRSSMRDSEPVQIDEKRHQLLKAKFGWLLTWSNPATQKTIGPYDPEPFENYDSRRSELVELCRDQLARYSDAQIAILTDRGQPDPENIRQAWRSFADDGIERLANFRLPWFAAGFGHPDYLADVDYWSKMTHFSIAELACLSVGVDPRHFDSFELGPSRKPGTAELLPTQDFLRKRLEQLRRQFDPYSHKFNVAPQEFLTWVDKVSFEVEPEFLSLLRRYSQPEPKPAPPVAPPKPDKREVNSIAQLFTAMVMEYYAYRPGSRLSTATRDVTDLAASMGMEISEDTVRKYLKIGAEFIPEGWEPNRR